MNDPCGTIIRFVWRKKDDNLSAVSSSSRQCHHPRKRMFQLFWTVSDRTARLRRTGYPAFCRHKDCLEHAIADREGVMWLGPRQLARRCQAIGQMPRSELIGMAGVRREPQLEPAWRLARQIEDHDAVCGPII